MKNIAIVCGGYSKEKVISFKSAEEITKAIDSTLFNSYLVEIVENKWEAVGDFGRVPMDKNDFSFTANGTKITFDAVFMAIHGTPGEDGKMQAYFEMLHIPVTTGDSINTGLTFNKYACKAMLMQQGILSAKAVLLRRGDTVDASAIVEQLSLPIFVKPNNGGSSFGVTKVKKAEDLKDAVDKALLEDTEAILEEFIAGREITNGVFISNEKEWLLPVTEIISKTEFFDYEAKYEGLSDEVTPAKIGDELTSTCKALSKKIYKLLNCKGVVRIDYLVRDNQLYFMEVNTVPGMSKASIIPQQVRVEGYEVSHFYTKLIEDAIIRQEN